jgi:hypothetical protein
VTQRSHPREAHDHAHTAAPAPRETYRESSASAPLDDRTMPSPHRIPDAIPRQEPSEDRGNGGGKDEPSGEHHE